MSDDKPKLTFQYAAENRKNEIALLWSRSLYFWGFSTVLLTAYGLTVEHHKTLAALAACFGVISGLCWSLANRGSRYWQSVWEKKTEAAEVTALDQSIFRRDTNPYVEARWFWGARQYSPSKLALAMSDLSVLGWLLLVLGTMGSRLIPDYHWLLVLTVFVVNVCLLVFTGTAAAIVLLWCRSGDAMSLRWGYLLTRVALRRAGRRLLRLISN